MMFIPSYKDVPFDLPFPMPSQFVALRMDPVAMVKPLRDPQATAEAKRIKPKKYLIFLTSVRVIHFHDRLWDYVLISSVACGSSISHESLVQIQCMAGSDNAETGRPETWNHRRYGHAYIPQHTVLEVPHPTHATALLPFWELFFLDRQHYSSPREGQKGGL